MNKEQILFKTVQALTTYGWTVKTIETGWMWINACGEVIESDEQIEGFPVFPRNHEI